MASETQQAQCRFCAECSDDSARLIAYNVGKPWLCVACYLATALANIRTAVDRIGWDRGAGDAARFAHGTAIDALVACGYDPFAGGAYHCETRRAAGPTTPEVSDER